MEEQNVGTSEVAVEVQTVEAKPENMPLADLKAQIEQLASKETEVQELPVEKPAVVQPEKTTEQPAPEQGKAEQVETIDKVTFEELQKKTGVKTPDDLAKNYRELQKELTKKAQELANLKKNAQQGQPQEKEISQDELLAKRIQEVGTVQALKELNESINKPIYEQIKQETLRNKIHELQNKPETAEFNLPEVQEEIRKIVTERPHQFTDGEGMIFPDALEDLYWMAKGRVGLINAGIKPKSEVPKPAPVEGKSKPSTGQIKVNPQTMPLKDLEALIHTLKE
jgi:hypothetical protein